MLLQCVATMIVLAGACSLPIWYQSPDAFAVCFSMLTTVSCCWCSACWHFHDSLLMLLQCVVTVMVLAGVVFFAITGVLKLL